MTQETFEQMVERVAKTFPALYEGAPPSECLWFATRLRDELAKDAERYRWLRDVELQDWTDLYHQNPERIDAAIDAAMQGKESGNG